MGLFDALNSYEGQQALGLLAAAGGRSDGAGFGQRMLEGLGQGEKWKAAQAQEEMRKQQLAAQQQQMQMQAMQMEQAKRQLAKENAIEALLPRFQKKGSAALSPLAGNEELGILPSQGRAAVAPSFDYKGYAAALAGIDPIKALTLNASLQKETPINKLDVKDFSPASVAKFAQTGNYGDLVRMDKAHFANTGGETVAVNPFTGERLSSLQNTQSPDSKASNALGWANYGLSGQRLSMDKETQGKPQWIESLGGFVDPKQRVVRPAVDSQGNPIQTGAGGKSTEGERTAATLLQRMRSSEAQLEDALAGGKTGAEKPSIISNALRGMGAEMAANTWDSPARQKVESAQLDILDAALTLGTGAAYTREQLEGYRKSYFPQVGDDAAAVKDKQDRLNNILKAAEIKAGNAAKSVPSVQELKASRQGVAQNGWSIQKVD